MIRRAAGSLWLPFTQMERFDERSPRFVRGEGAYLYDDRGNRLFDAVSSIWTTIHGHCHPRITDAISRQAQRLDHSTLLGASNPVAEELAAKLTALAGLDYAFFASDGASAIEAALKMALQFWQNRGEPQRTRFVRLTGAYHGDTAAAMSVSDIALFKLRFDAVTFESLRYDASSLERPDVAAVIVEPIVQAAAGMRVVPEAHYAPLREIAPLLIVDEIATGFGRTGTMFAFDQLDLRPDIVCCGKGLTGGALALSATLATERVFEAFLGIGPSEHFFHGHSFAGNPIACAAALANLAIFDEEGTLEHVRALERDVKPDLETLSRNPKVREVRGRGLMIGIEIVTPGWRAARELYSRGYFTRPIGDVLQFVPPLCSDRAELAAFLENCHDILG